MTREESRQRRKKIAAAARKSKGIRETAEEFGVSTALVRKACREFGVKTPAERGPIAPTDDQVIAELRSGKSPQQLARQFSITMDEVAEIQQSIVDGGVRNKRRGEK